jgi:hypothetical protein
MKNGGFEEKDKRANQNWIRKKEEEGLWITVGFSFFCFSVTIATSIWLWVSSRERSYLRALWRTKRKRKRKRKREREKEKGENKKMSEGCFSFYCEREDRKNLEIIRGGNNGGFALRKFARQLKKKKERKKEKEK